MARRLVAEYKGIDGVWYEFESQAARPLRMNSAKEDMLNDLHFYFPTREVRVTERD